MRRKEANGCIWFEFDHLSNFPMVRHGSFSRKGGVSTGAFASLNGGFGADNPQHVAENRARMMRQLCPNEPVVLKECDQVHGCTIAYMNEKSGTVQADALITDSPHLALLIKHADCQAALFFDPDHQVIANVHAGWRGNVACIYQHVVRYMTQKWNSRPEAILVGIVPSLGPEASEFCHWEEELFDFAQYQHRPNYFDLWAIANDQLIAAGIAQHNIEIAKICTYTENELFFSYRKDKITGRNMTAIALVPS